MQKVSNLERKSDTLDAVVFAKESVNLASITSWELGLINNQNGKKTESTNRICTPEFIDITGLSAISYSLSFDSVGVTFSFYDNASEDDWIESTASWLSDSG